MPKFSLIPIWIKGPYNRVHPLEKKLARLERKYERLKRSEKIKQARLIKSYLATKRKLAKLRGLI
jgi:hypothetical protein